MSKYLYYCLLCLVALGATACMSEDDAAQHKALVDQREFELLSVVSHQRGQAVSLSLDLEQSGEDLRSLQFNEQGATGALELVNVGTTEQMHLFLYKEGEPASLSTATITWQGRTQTSIKLNKIDFNLAPGYSFRTGDTWLVAGVLGGQLDPQTRRVQMGAPRSADAERAFPADAMVDMPYALSWQRMSITRDNYGAIPKATLQPVGTLLRLHFFSNMIEDYTASALQLETNALRPTGTFDPMADKALGALPSWTAEEADSDTPLVWNYRLGNNARSLTLPAGGGYDAGRTLYLWAMPTGVREQNTATTIRLNVIATGQSGTPSTQTTYEKRGHRTLKSGHSYRLSNVLTSDLMISEIYYQFSKANQAPASGSQQNYSIVELYNPTASEINLSDYALARLTFGGAAFNHQYVYTTQGDLADMRLHNPLKAQMLALSAITGSMNDLSGFSERMGTHRASADRYKVVYGTPALKLGPGQTLLLGADGYINRDMKPSKNIELFNAALATNPNLATSPTAVQGIEKPYYPRAGMQIDSAVRAGYAQSMVAMDNGRYTKLAPSNTSGAGVLLMDNGDGIALFKRVYTAKGGRDLQLVDITSPVGDAAASTAYRQKLLSEYNRQVKTPISALVTQDAIAYSIVRTTKSSFPRPQLNADEWQVAVSENGGVKSLGTRYYVAGLSPFAPEYTGYNTSNNPQGLPFWGNRSFTPATKQWDKLPGVGQNSFTDGITMAPSYERIPVVRATSTRVGSPNRDIRKSYDGDLTTYYEAPRNADASVWPARLVYTFDAPALLDHIKYYPGQQNGSFGMTHIEVEYEDGSTSRVLSKDLAATNETKYIRWDGISSRKIKSVTFIVDHAYYKMLSVQEMEFMRASLDLSQIFEDAAYSRLRSGITYKDIMAIPDLFYREMARQMYQGTYPREFRIADYQSYPNPDRARAANLTQFPLSLFDNPTGISVQKDERILVFVDNPSGQRLRIAVQDFFAQRSDTDHYTAYVLNHGVNVITPNRSGLLYLLYHSNDTERNTLPQVRVHIAGGKVNGYYDSQNPKHQGRWAELLAKAVDPHFDVMSENIHLVYPTQKFRSLVPDPLPLLDIYERILRAEWELMGLYKYNKLFRNRLESRVIHDDPALGFFELYAFYYRTSFHNRIVDNYMRPQYLSTGVWGLAHEIGHVHQTVGLNWGGMREVTVNIFAAYVQFVTLGNPFRGLAGNDDWFTRGWNRLLEKPGVTVSMISKDGDPQTSMFQLELYLGQVLGKTPTKMADKGGFYPELFELLRRAHAGKGNPTADPVNNGNQQAELAYYASKAAGLDLTDFFERWGYLRPVDNVEFIATYNEKYRITLTQQKVDQVKAQIRALGLPKPGVAFEYITTRNMDMFRTPRAVVPGTASRDGQTLRFTGWQNVVAWEVVDASGGLVYTSTGWQQDFAAGTAGFTLPVELPWQTGYRVRAISAKGQRTVVTL